MQGGFFMPATGIDPTREAMGKVQPEPWAKRSFTQKRPGTDVLMMAFS